MTDRATKRIAGWGSFEGDKEAAFTALDLAEKTELLVRNERTLERAFYRLDVSICQELSHLSPQPRPRDMPVDEVLIAPIVTIPEALPVPEPVVDILDEVAAFSALVRMSLESDGIEMPPVPIPANTKVAA